MWTFNKYKRTIKVTKDGKFATITIASSDNDIVQALHAIITNKMYKPRQLDINTDVSVTDTFNQILKVLGQVK